MDQQNPDTQTTGGECTILRHRPGPRIILRAMNRARPLNALRQNVSSKLDAESSCRITTPAILQRRVTKIINSTARECDMIV